MAFGVRRLIGLDAGLGLPPMVGDADPMVGLVVEGRFRLDEAVSPSTTSTKFAATDTTDGRPVFVRIFTEDASKRWGDDVLRQAAAVSRIDHPSVLRPVAHGRTSIDGVERVWVATDRPLGGTLQDMLDRGRRVTPSQATVIGVEICRALDRAHRRGIVHFDLRPSAIVFSERLGVSLADLGIVAAPAESAWSDPSSVSIERARYASPEQALGQPFDEKADVYALALVLVEAMSGTVPFLTDSVVGTLSGRVDRLFPVSADFGPLASVLDKAGRAEPEDRSSAADMGRALVQAAASLPRPTPLPIVVADNTSELVLPADTVFASEEVAPPVVESESLDEPIDDIVDEADVVDRPLVGRWVLAAVAVLAVVVGGFFAYRALRDDSAAIPDLAGVPEGQATNSVTQFGWNVVTVVEFSDSFDAGEVIRTEPPFGEDLSSGDTLTLVVSSGPPPVPLPDVVGLDGQGAADRLAESGLVAVVVEEFSEDVEKGVVVRWAVSEQPNLTVGDEVVKGTSVDVFVSKGPEPRTLPDLKGQLLADAERALGDLRLVVRRDADQFFPDVPLGAVGSQTPPAGTQVERDSEVVVVVSKGPDLVTIPNVRRLNFEQVKKVLTDAGFVIGNVTGRTRGALVGMISGGRLVASGELLARGSVIDLAYYGS